MHNMRTSKSKKKNSTLAVPMYVSLGNFNNQFPSLPLFKIILLLNETKSKEHKILPLKMGEKINKL